MNRIFIILIIGIGIVISGFVVIELALNMQNGIIENQKSLNSDIYLTAVTYYGDAWPINFWSSDFSSTDQNMERIKKDGFNTIILIIPWGEFQPGISPIQYNDIAFDRLNYIIQKANSHDLNVVLRIGYTWDYYPEVQLPQRERVLELGDDQVYNAWLDYIHQIYINVKNYQNVKLAFISWEEHWYRIKAASVLQDVDDRIELAHNMGFSDYLKSRYDLGYVSKIYGNNFSSWEKVPTPLRNSTAFELLLKFFDEEMVEKFLKPAQKQYPNLSMEVRVDWDPIYHKNGTISWYSHSSTFNIAESDYTTIYYSQSMGAPNINDYQSASAALSLMNNTFQNVKKYTDKNKIFIDQFIWFDNTPGFENSTEIYENEIDSFLLRSCTYLKNYTNGYGVWTYHDYTENLVYNPTFSLGTLGWSTSGTTYLEENAITLEQGSSLTQTIMTKGLRAIPDPSNLAFYAKSETPTADISIDFGNARYTKHITTGLLYELQRPTGFLPTFNITFTALNGTTTISDVKMYNFILRGDVYDTNWEPKRFVKPIQQLNQCLS